MVFHYCPACGMELHKKGIGDEGLVPFCLHCSRPYFNFSYPCVICLVINEKKEIALIKQSYVSENYICIAGFVKQGETIEESAKREVEEEIGLKVIHAAYINSYYYEKRDNLMLGFVCTVNKDAFKISEEVDQADWFSLEDTKNHLRKGSTGKDLLNDFLKTNKK